MPPTSEPRGLRGLDASEPTDLFHWSWILRVGTSHQILDLKAVAPKAHQLRSYHVSDDFGCRLVASLRESPFEVKSTERHPSSHPGLGPASMRLPAITSPYERTLCFGSTVRGVAVGTGGTCCGVAHRSWFSPATLRPL